MMPAAQVLIVGAGPTGLALAAQIHAHGGQARIVERRYGYRRSRAFVMQPRTLEMLAPLGVAGQLIARGDASAQARIHAGARVAVVRLAHPDVDDTAYPFLLAIPQATVEEVLEQHLARVGVAVERGVELTGISARPDSVDCTLLGPDGRPEQATADYLVGCDGADSTVRRLVGIPFPGRRYRPALLLADLDVGGELEPDTVHGFVGAPGILFLFPSPEGPAWRLLTVSPAGAGPAPAPDLALLQSVADRFTGGGLRLRDPTWADTVRLRRGQATRYRAGRVLLAGDAAHVQSPAGAQGMNTGIQDACNLGWKLALVAAGAADESLLDSYQAERWPVARRVRQLTDLAFRGEAAGTPPLGWLRQHAAPLLVLLAGDRTIPAWAFRLLGGLLIRHRGSPAVQAGGSGPGNGPRPGDRLVDGRVVSGGREGWLHEMLCPPGHHLLLCGRTDAFDLDLAAALERWSGGRLRVHRLAREPRPGELWDRTGRLLARLGDPVTAAYLVRPDGYIAFRSAGPDLAGIAAAARRPSRNQVNTAAASATSDSSIRPIA